MPEKPTKPKDDGFKELGSVKAKALSRGKQVAVEIKIGCYKGNLTVIIKDATGNRVPVFIDQKTASEFADIVSLATGQLKPQK